MHDERTTSVPPVALLRRRTSHACEFLQLAAGRKQFHRAYDEAMQITRLDCALLGL